MRHSIYSDGRINIIKSYFLYFHSVRFFFPYRIILTDYPLLLHPVTVSLYLYKGDCSTALRLAAFSVYPLHLLSPFQNTHQVFWKTFPAVPFAAFQYRCHTLQVGNCWNSPLHHTGSYQLLLPVRWLYPGMSQGLEHVLHVRSALCEPHFCLPALQAAPG